jgi:N-ethylmaleimide reductase
MEAITIDDQTGPTFDYVIQILNASMLAYLHLLEPMKPVDDIPYAISHVAEHFRPLYAGTLIINKGLTFETGTRSSSVVRPTLSHSARRTSQIRTW